MKKRIGWIVTGCVLLCLAVILAAAGYFLDQGLGVSVGRYLESSGGPMVILEDLPVCMSCRGAADTFSGLGNGDKILVVHDGIKESYPGQTGVYFCMRLENGDILDIPEQTLCSVQEMGWYDDGLTQTAVYDGEYGTMSLELPGDWDYRTQKENNSYGIYFWPAGCEDTPMYLGCWPEGFGVCGTGLTWQTATLGAYEATIAYCTVEGEKRLDHVYFTDLAGDYAVVSHGLGNDWETFGEQLMTILRSIRIETGAIGRAEALETAKTKCTVEYEGTVEIYDCKKGTWTVHFYPDEATAGGDQTVVVGKDGTVREVTYGE